MLVLLPEKLISTLHWPIRYVTGVSSLASVLDRTAKAALRRAMVWMWAGRVDAYGYLQSARLVFLQPSFVDLSNPRPARIDTPYNTPISGLESGFGKDRYD